MAEIRYGWLGMESQLVAYCSVFGRKRYGVLVILAINEVRLRTANFL